jgi:LasA protease
MKRIKPVILARCLVLLLALAAPAPVFSHEGLPLVMADGRFSGFDAIGYVNAFHPRLSSSAEAISHWAAYHGLNPILLANAIAVLPGDQSPPPRAIRDLAASLARLETGRGESSVESASAGPIFAIRLGEALALAPESVGILIDRVRAETAAAGLSAELAVLEDAPPALDLPFARPQTWQFNGVHTWTGDDDGSPMSSIDFTRSWSQGWGDDTSQDRVSAAHDGEVSVYSSCFVQVQHRGGFATRYYHLDKLEVVNGQRVTAGDVLGTYAGDQDQALCSGGQSTGPHLHFALLRNGQYFSLQDVRLSGYRVQPGSSSYDSSHDRMWLEKRGVVYYAYQFGIGTVEGDNTIDYRYNGMWYSLDSNGHGLNVEITEFPGEPASRKSVFVVIYTYDDNGNANFYAGNADFERWRSDETLVIDMLQTAGGDFSNLASIDFDDPGEVRVAGQLEIGFRDCNNAVIGFELEERSSGQPVDHLVELVKLIGVPQHVCEAASLPLP